MKRLLLTRMGVQAAARNRREKGWKHMKRVACVWALTVVVTLTNAYGETNSNAPTNYASPANNDFALDLYNALLRESPGKNQFFSPYSISCALAMAAEGALGETAAEMVKVLRYPEAVRHAGNDSELPPWNMALIHAGMAALNTRFRTKPVPQELQDKLAAARQELAASQAKEKEFEAAGKWQQWEEQIKKSKPLVDRVNVLLTQTSPYEIRVANALYGEKTYPFRQEYLDTINRFYGSGAVVPVDFIHQFEAVRLQINGWVEKQTNARIKDLLAESSLNELTRLVLVNAIYFKGEWVVPFDEKATKTEDFLAGDGRKTGVRMMFKYGLGNGRYGAFNADGGCFATPKHVSWRKKPDPASVYPGKGGFLVAELPYKGNELSMVLVVPRDVDGLGAVEKRLTSTNLQVWLDKLESRGMHVQMPKFRLETDYQQMKETLQAMGMKQAFDPGAANFNGMCASGKAEMFISKVAHKAFVEVTEKGTEAAAATAIPMPLVEPEPAEDIPFTPTVRADRPFLFAIRDVQTGTLLFFGRLVEPAAASASREP